MTEQMRRRRALMGVVGGSEPKYTMLGEVQLYNNGAPMWVKDSATSFHCDNKSSTNWQQYVETISCPYQVKDLVGKRIGIKFKRSGSATGLETTLAFTSQNAVVAASGRQKFTTITPTVNNGICTYEKLFSEIPTLGGQAANYPNSYLKIYWFLYSSTAVSISVSDIEFYYTD